MISDHMASVMADAPGFEPGDQISPVGNLAGSWYKPLTHTSIYSLYVSYESGLETGTAALNRGIVNHLSL